MHGAVPAHRTEVFLEHLDVAQSVLQGDRNSVLGQYGNDGGRHRCRVEGFDGDVDGIELPLEVGRRRRGAKSGHPVVAPKTFDP